MAWKGLYYDDPVDLTEIEPVESATFDMCPWKTIAYDGVSYADEMDNEFEDIYVAEDPGPAPDPS